MAIHSVARVFILAPVVLTVIGIALAISAIARRRGLARLQRMQARPIAAMPVRSQPSGGKSMRHYIWGVLILLIVLGAATKGVYQARSASYQFEPATVYTWEPPTPPRFAPAITEMEVRLPVPPKPPTPPHKAKTWYKPARPAAPEPEPRWHATITQSTFPAVRELNPREELLQSISKKLESELHLHLTPPREFVANPQFVRVVGSDEKTLDEKDPENGAVVTIKTDVELTPDGFRELGRLERLDRSESRMEIAVRGLGLLTILFGVIAAYIRLDEWTKGYYTGRLFLLATAIVAGLGVLIVRPM